MAAQNQITIAGRRIGPAHPPYVIAEMSGNHNGDLNRALAILDMARAAGADAVKLQTYTADTITIDHDAPEFIVHGGLWDGRQLYELYAEAHTPWEWHAPLFAHARKIGITIFSAPFDPTAVALLEDLGAPAYKIASPEIVDIGLIRTVAATGKPMIMSTGMASLEEIEEAVTAARGAGAREIALLHCVSAYPTPPEDANLATIPDLARRFGVSCGLSDHSMGTEVAMLAVGLGADVIEKHVTLSRADGGVDSAFSLEPFELEKLVRDVRLARAAIGAPSYGEVAAERTARAHRRSLYVVAPISAGEALSAANIRSIRPAKGLKPKYLEQVIGRRALRDLAFGEPLDESMFEGGLA